MTEGFAGLPEHLQPRGGRDLPIAQRSADAETQPGLCAACAWTNHDFRRVCRNCGAPLPTTPWNTPRPSSAETEAASSPTPTKEA